MKAFDALLGLELAGNDQLDVRAGLALPEDHLISSVALALQIVSELCQGGFRPPTEEGDAGKELYLGVMRILNVLKLCVVEGLVNHCEGAILQAADGG